MPASALRSVVVDRVVPLDSLAAVLAELVTESGQAQTEAAPGSREASGAASSAAIAPGAPAHAPQEAASPVASRIPVHLAREHAIASGEGDVVGELDSLGRVSRYSCPDCGGTMWQIHAPGPTRFRCHTGHGYSIQSLIAAQSTRIEQALWEAIRALQEKVMMLRQASGSERRAGDASGAEESERRAGQYEEQVRALRELAVAARGSKDA